MKQTEENNENVSEENYFSDSLYDDEEEIVYAAFDGGEAAQIIFPLEENSATETVQSPAEASDINPPKKQRSVSLQARAFFTGILPFVEKTGSVTIGLLKKVFSAIKPFAVFPFAVAFSFLKRVFSSLRRFFVSMPKEFTKEVKSIRFELKIIKKQAGITDEYGKASFLRAVRKYFFISFSRHSIFWKSVFNFVFPVVAAVILLVSLNGNSKKITALEVIYNGKSIGYIENDEVFERGKALASELLPAKIEGNDYTEALNREPVYKVRHVELNKLSNDKMLCESIVSETDKDLSRACGIYIDGEFFCAVANQSDAASAFDSLLLPHRDENDKDKIIAFVEEIEYVEGLYPKESIWDSTKLRKVLKTPKSKNRYYKAKKHDSAKLIAKKFSLSLSQLKALNPNVNFAKLKKGKKILVAAQTNYVRVKVMKTRTKTQTVKFETEKKKSSSIAKGTTKTVQQGKNGKIVITELVTYINNRETYSTVISQKQTVAPVNKIIYIGTRTSSGYSTGSYGYSSNYGVSQSYSGFIWPTRGAYSLSSGFGNRSASISGWSFHGGVDIVKPGGGSTGTPVVASAAGTVVVAQSGYSGYGHTVVIDHGGGIRTRYAHMQPGSIRVHVGQSVYKGQQIGNIGSTGNVTGPHLHFEVLKNGAKVNPMAYIG